ncbi:hypothetical protein [Flavobacterium sp. CLA17]|uniref:hypothetical protein n=1 Tax=Flavobacterium sp. CLA17 TaxID=2724135 RepID=UPI00351BCA70
MFFGIHPKLELLSLLELLIPLLFGFIFAFLNDFTVHKIQLRPTHLKKSNTFRVLLFSVFSDS